MIKTTWEVIPPVALLATRALAHMATRDVVSTCEGTAVAIGCSISYLEQIFAELRRAGLIQAQRGPGGGYRLTRAAGSIQIGDIVAALVADEQRLPAALDQIRDQLKQVLSLTTLQQYLEAS